MTEKKYYIIVNKYNTPLTMFSDGAGWEIKETFKFSNRTFEAFRTKEKAQQKLAYYLKTAEEQRDRWGSWTDTCLKFMQALKECLLDLG